ncbi:MAG: hypothetical protein ABFE07_19025 [Armatimonadia bacterium]
MSTFPSWGISPFLLGGPADAGSSLPRRRAKGSEYEFAADGELTFRLTILVSVGVDDRGASKDYDAAPMQPGGVFMNQLLSKVWPHAFDVDISILQRTLCLPETLGLQVSRWRLTWRYFFGAAFLGAAFFGAAFLGAAFLGAAFLGAAFFGAAFFGAAFFGAAFLGAAFFGAAFFGSAFLGAAFFGAAFFGSAFLGAAFFGAAFFGAADAVQPQVLAIGGSLPFGRLCRRAR